MVDVTKSKGVPPVKFQMAQQAARLRRLLDSGAQSIAKVEEAFAERRPGFKVRNDDDTIFCATVSFACLCSLVSCFVFRRVSSCLRTVLSSKLNQTTHSQVAVGTHAKVELQKAVKGASAPPVAVIKIPKSMAKSNGGTYRLDVSSAQLKAIHSEFVH